MRASPAHPNSERYDLNDIVIVNAQVGKMGMRKLLIGLVMEGPVYVLDITTSEHMEMSLTPIGLANEATQFGAAWVYEGHVYFSSNDGAGV
eukprot:1957638-Amphidinium_carterae.1